MQIYFYYSIGSGLIPNKIHHFARFFVKNAVCAIEETSFF